MIHDLHELHPPKQGIDYPVSEVSRSCAEDSFPRHPIARLIGWTSGRLLEVNRDEFGRGDFRREQRADGVPRGIVLKQCNDFVIVDLHALGGGEWFREGVEINKIPRSEEHTSEL